MKRLLPLLLVTIVAACSLERYTPSAKLIRQAELTNAPVNDTVECRNSLGLNIVYVRINDHEEPLEFIFDTGANLTVVSADAAKRIGLETDGDIDLGDSKNQRQQIPLTMIDTLRLGKGIYTNVIAAIIAFPENSTITCIAKDGILGYHVIRQMQWSIHPGDTIMVGSTEDLRDDEERYHTVDIPGWKAPMMSVDFGRVSFHNVLFDSGSSGGLDVEKRHSHFFSDTIQLIKDIDGTSQGVYGNQLDTLLRRFNDTIEIDGVSIPSNIDFSEMDSRKVGMGTLGSYHLIIDGPNEELHIGRREIPYRPTKTYGMIPGLSDTTLYVASFQPEGHAADLGFELQQPLRAVNGMTAEDINAMECGYLQFLLMIRNSNEALEVETMDGRLIRVEGVVY